MPLPSPQARLAWKYVFGDGGNAGTSIRVSV